MVEWWLWRHHLHEIYANGDVYRVIRVIRMEEDRYLSAGYYLTNDEYREFIEFVQRMENLPGGTSTGY